MLRILGLILPLFALIGIGHLAVRRNLLEPAGLAALTGFAYWLALPALLFSSVAEASTPGMINVAGIYLASCLLVFGLAGLVGRWMLKGSLAKTAVFGLNATYGNVIFLGTPLVVAVFGPPALPLILGIIAFHSGVLLPLAAVLIELDTGRQGGAAVVVRHTVVKLLQNPIVMSILGGFLWRATGVPLPAPVHQLLSLVGQAAAPVALFCLGASLPPMVRDPMVLREAAWTTALKLLVLPLCVGTLSWMMGLSGLPWRVAVLTAAMPTGSNAFLLARRTTGFAAASASTVVIATSASVLTITLLISWFY